MANTTSAILKPRPKRSRQPLIGPDSAGRLMTTAEFDALTYDDCVEGYRYELINGVLVVSPAVSSAEGGPNDDLGYLLRLYRETHPSGRCLDATLPERDIFLPKNRRRADRVIWTGLGRRPDERRDVPSIVIEFVSPGRRAAIRDYETKRDEYLGFGVKEDWVIDRFLRQLTVFRPGPEGPIVTVVPEGQNHESPLLPGFVLPLGRLLIEADDWLEVDASGLPSDSSPPAGGIDG